MKLGKEDTASPWMKTHWLSFGL